jgi:hypothetical protein
MRLCPTCPPVDEYGDPVEPNPSRDQRPWTRDGRCYTCHHEIMTAKSVRKAEKRKARSWRVRVTPNQRLVNWARV